MINRIQIHNFQSHDDTTLELGAGINVLIGSSDSGKSAVIRALHWLTGGGAQGLAYLHDKADDGTVRVRVDGHNEQGWFSVIRTRSKDVNSYMLVLNDETYEFDVVGRNIPEEVATVLNMHPINYQLQLDLPYLILSSPGKLAEAINRVCGLDRLGGFLKHITHKEREDIHRRDVYKQEGVVLKESLGDNGPALVARLEKEAGVQAQLERWITENEAICERVTSAIRSCEVYQEQLQELVGAKKQVSAVQNIITRLERLIDTYDTVQSKREAIHRTIQKVGALRSVIKQARIHCAATKKMLSVFNTAGVLTSEFVTREDEAYKVRDAIQTVRLWRKKIHNARNAQAKARKDLDLYIEKEGIKLCPMCGQQVSKEQLIGGSE